MHPIKITDADFAFGGRVAELLPTMDDIPDEFKKGNTKWNKVVNDWFFGGLKNCQWTPKEGIEENDAIRHVSSVMQSYKPKHEHKAAGCAYLLSQFFEDVKYES